jgi:U3 small nucleolar RNA-associated protein 24
MGKAKKVRQYRLKKILSPKDVRLKDNQKKEKKKAEQKLNYVKATPSALFFRYNTELGPPYHILVDTNFINFSIQNKLEIISEMMNCLFAKCIPCITDCVVGELEKLGPKFRVALRIVKDPRFERIPCQHKGTYADDCLVKRVEMHKCYIVATCDKDLRRRIRKIPGVPIMYISGKRYSIERLPDALGAPKT